MLRGANAHTHYFPGVLVPFVLMGIGAGLAFMPLLTIATALVPSRDAGLASAIVNALLQMSAAWGLAVLATVAADHTRTLAAHGQSHAVALLGGYHLAFLIAAVGVGAAVVASLVWLREPTRPAAVARPSGYRTGRAVDRSRSRLTAVRSRCPPSRAAW